jgi:hypothetical protein
MVAGRGMHHHSRRFIEDRQVGVLKEDLQRDGFGAHAAVDRFRQVDRDDHPLMNNRVGLQRRS